MIEPKENIKKILRTPSDCMDRVGSVVRLDKNERTTPFLKKHFKEMLNSISAEEITAYPELEPFYTKLAKWLKVSRDQVLVTCGSDTGIRAVYEVYVDKGDEVLIFPPTYAMYSVYCDMFGGVKREVFYRDDLSLSMDEALSVINQKIKLIVIANPNHTGTPLPPEDILRILKVAKENESLVLVDEAYYHFYKLTALPYIEEFQNLIVVRTFSKAFGIAGLRIGYLVSNKDIISQLYKVKLTHEITSVSAKMGEYLISHLEIMEDYVSDVNKGKEYLSEEFAKLGITSPKSHTNFLFAKLPRQVNAEFMVKLLRERRFSISGPFSTVPLKGFIRITVGPVKQMQDFMSVFKSVYDKARDK